MEMHCLMHNFKKLKVLSLKHNLTMPGKARGRNETLAQGLLSLVRYGPVVGEDSAFQLVQVGRGELHAAPRAIPILIVAPLQHTYGPS